MTTKTLTNDVVLFAPIDLAKVSQEPDGTLLVPAVFSTERVDDQGERVTYEALQKAAPDYMQWAAVNEMHQLSAVGTTVELNLDDELRKATGTLHIVDPLAVQKVLTGVYRGTSIEGRKLHRSLSKVAGAKWDVDDIQWNRISLADRPSNPDAVLLLAKAAGADEETAMKIDATPEPVAPQTASPAATEAVPALAKTAADDAAWAMSALDNVNLLIEHEVTEPKLDPGQVATLKGIQAGLLKFIGSESAEVDSPENIAEIAEEKAEPDILLVYNTAIGDLQKITSALTERLQKITPVEGELVTLEASEAPDFGALLKVALSDEETLAKVATVVSDRIGQANKEALDAMKVELLEGFKPSKELLEKVAKMAAPGGPVRYAERGGRVGIEEQDEDDPASVLRKAAGLMESRNPAAAASAREMAAATMVGQIRKGG
jgi:hypothetical protein